MLLYILFAVVWIAIAFWPARVAHGRRQLLLYFLFSLVFLPWHLMPHG
jgi:hypothetical protein